MIEILQKAREIRDSKERVAAARHTHSHVHVLGTKEGFKEGLKKDTKSYPDTQRLWFKGENEKFGSNKTERS